eukprot:307668_1
MTYNLPSTLLRSSAITTSLTFTVGPKNVNALRMVERHYFRNELLRSYEFDFGFCIANSTNDWEGTYDVPKLSNSKKSYTLFLNRKLLKSLSPIAAEALANNVNEISAEHVSLSRNGHLIEVENAKDCSTVWLSTNSDVLEMQLNELVKYCGFGSKTPECLGPKNSINGFVTFPNNIGVSVGSTVYLIFRSRADMRWIYNVQRAVVHERSLA